MRVKVDIAPVRGKRGTRRSVRDLVEAVMASEDVGGAVAVAFVDESEMSGLNERFRGSTGPTDVLSFSTEDDECEWPDPAGEKIKDMGEVVLCPAVIERYAHEEDGDPATQMGRTIMHGVLHLLGYDHEEDDGEMRARERSLLLELDSKIRAASAAFGR